MAKSATTINVEAQVMACNASLSRTYLSCEEIEVRSGNLMRQSCRAIYRRLPTNATRTDDEDRGD